MSGDLKYIAVLIGIWLLLKYMPAESWTRIVMTVLGRKGLEGVGRAALAKQPDRITVVPQSEGPGKPEARSALEQLVRREFAPAGSFVVREMKDLPVHFMVKPAECAVAVVYEHPKAGVWCGIVSRFRDGESWMITNANLGGSLEDRPGHVRIRAPGLTPTALHHRFLRERPRENLVAVPATDVARFFAKAYEEEMAWRKGRGLSSREVRGAAMESHRKSA